jgi:hypothetical protein
MMPTGSMLPENAVGGEGEAYGRGVLYSIEHKV